MLLRTLFFTLIALFAPAASQLSAGCSGDAQTRRDRSRRCQESLVRNIQRRLIDMNRSEMQAHCDTIRDDFNCLLEATVCITSDTERMRNGDTLRKTIKYLREGCEGPGESWSDSTCYVGEGMKTCENSYPLGGAQLSSYNPETCRKYNLFKDCVTEVTRNRCRPKDERLMGQYLVDTAQDLAWNCGQDSGSSDTGRTRDVLRDRDYERDRDRYQDRDRDLDRGRDRDRDRDGGRDWDRGGSRDSPYSRDRDLPWSDRNDRNGGYDRNANSDITCCSSERCSTSRLQRCKDSLSRTIDIRISGYQDMQKCRKARDDFNCVLWQTANCQGRNERDTDNDLFRRARDYISRNCDTYGRWSENSCYKSSEMRRCENLLSTTRGGANFESCRSYASFRDCMENEIRRRCTKEDELYQGAYLVDKANELSWQCGGYQSSSSGGYNGNRNQYFTNEYRRDPYDNNNYGGGGYDNPPHLDDEDELCHSRIKSYIDQCDKELVERRRETYTANEYEERQRITCCSARKYRSCLYDATRRVCQSDNSRVVDASMGRYGYELASDQCRRIYDEDCNSGSRLELSFVLLLAYFVALPLLTMRYLQ